MSFYEHLKSRLLGGEWTTGQRLPSIRKMTTNGKVSHHTVVSAYARLVSEGLLDAQQGRGYYVSRWADQADTLPVVPALVVLNPLFKLLQAQPDQIKLGCGWLPLPWRDTEMLAKAVRKTARQGQSVLVEYGDIQGYLPLRKQLSIHLRKSTGIEVAPQQMLTTLGATQALDLVSRLLIKPGDHVLVDEPCNGNLIKLIRLCGGVPLGVPRRMEGPDIARLDMLLQAHQVKAYFCNSTFHNPTGAGLTPHIAFGVLRRAIEHDFIIVEDDVYGDFCQGSRQTFAELDNLEHVIYIGSFSKSLSASLRIGYVASSRSFVQALIELKLLTSVAVPGFCERFVNNILVDGTYAKHAQEIQRKLMTHQNTAQKALRKYGWEFDVEPDGGMFLWIGHPELPDLAPYIAGLEAKGILLMPGTSFSVAEDFQNRTRLNVAHLARGMSQALDIKQFTNFRRALLR